MSYRNIAARLRVTGVGLCVGAVAAVAVVWPGARPAPAAGTDREAVGRLLDRRAAAVMGRDEDAFMSTVAPISDDFVRRQRRLFDAMESVDFAGYSLEAAWTRYGDLARRSDQDRYPEASDVMIPLTEERYRIEAFDEEEATEDLLYTYVKQDDRWLIAEDTDLDDLGLYSARHLWDRGPVRSETSEHFLQLEHPCAGSDCLELPGDFLGLAERGVRQVDRYWDGRWHKHMVVLVPASTKELGRMLQSTIDLDNFVAFAYSTVDATRSFDYTGHRILLNPKAFEVASQDQVFTILAHELLHIATRDSAGPFLPVFVDEGFAEVAAYDGDPESLRFFDSEYAAGNFDGRLPQDFEFTTGEGSDIYGSYQKAQSAVKFLIGRWGLGAMNEFYRRLGAVDVAPGTTRYHLDRSLQATIGLGFDDFQSEWASSIEGS